MQITTATLDNFQRPAGAVVVIDVLRAFTTAAFAFSRSAEKIILMQEVEEALALKQEYPTFILAGEVDGKPIPGFDYGNSPAEISEAALAGRTIVQRTTAGTRGAGLAAGAAQVLCASFVNAKATAAYLHHTRAAEVTLLVTGTALGFDGLEDFACAKYLEALLRRDGEVSGRTLAAEVENSYWGRLFGDPRLPHFPRRDLELAMEVDRFDTALVAAFEGPHQVLRPCSPGGPG
jgi:2-phosphosulfolactate phosphatase